MKRLTALILSLILLLSLTACGSGEDGPVLQDILGKNTIISTEPEGPTEPKQENRPGNTMGKPSSGINKNNKPSEPTAGAPFCDDYSKYAGIYISDTSWSEYPIVLQIHVYGDILLLEYSAWEDGSLVYSWAEEFWPDPDILEDGELDNVIGYYQGFSVAYGTADYWSAAALRTILLTDDGLVFQEKDISYTYRRNDALPTIHSSFADQKCTLSGEPSAALAGEWGYNDPYSAGYLHMGSDGSFAFVWKDRHRPAEVWTGAWVTGSDTDQITVSAARIGDIEETYELQLDYSLEGSCRYLSYWGEEVDTVLADGIFLWPGDGQWSTGLSLEQLSSVFYELLHVDGTVEIDNGNSVYYIYRIPQFLDDFGSDALGQINSEIWERFWDPAQTELERIGQEQPPVTHMIESDYAAFDGLEQLILWTDSYYELPDCAVYCYDREQDTQLDTRAVLKRLGISEKDFLEEVRTAAEAYFMEMYGSWTKEQWQDMGCDAAFAWTVSDEAINLQLPVIIDSSGDLAVIARIGCTGDVDYCLAVLYPFSMAVG